METKQVIIQNKEEERQFLEEVEKRRYVWFFNRKPTVSFPSEQINFKGFPYNLLIENNTIYNYYGNVLTVSQFLDSK